MATSTGRAARLARRAADPLAPLVASLVLIGLAVAAMLFMLLPGAPTFLALVPLALAAVVSFGLAALLAYGGTRRALATRRLLRAAGFRAMWWRAPFLRFATVSSLPYTRAFEGREVRAYAVGGDLGRAILLETTLRPPPKAKGFEARFDQIMNEPDAITVELADPTPAALEAAARRLLAQAQAKESARGVRARP